MFAFPTSSCSTNSQIIQYTPVSKFIHKFTYHTQIIHNKIITNSLKKSSTTNSSTTNRVKQKNLRIIAVACGRRCQFRIGEGAGRRGRKGDVIAAPAVSPPAGSGRGEGAAARHRHRRLRRGEGEERGGGRRRRGEEEIGGEE